jgi:hypothetical protein
MRVSTGVTLVCLGFFANVRDARADDAALARPAPYSLPWALRPAALPTVVRVDSTLAMRDEDTVVATVLTLGVKVTDEFGFLARGALVHGIDGTASDSAVGNPLVGALYSPHVTESLRCGVFIAIAAPVGMGGGSSADPKALALMRAAIPARSSMDNALFATNYLTKAVGLSLAYVANGLTAQIEATAFILARTRWCRRPRDDTHQLHVRSRCRLRRLALAHPEHRSPLPTLDIHPTRRRGRRFSTRQPYLGDRPSWHVEGVGARRDAPRSGVCRTARQAHAGRELQDGAVRLACRLSMTNGSTILLPRLTTHDRFTVCGPRVGGSFCGRSRIRTCDFHRVKVALYR